MTAETLKPFITPTSAVNGYPAKQQSGVTQHAKRRSTRQLIPIILSIVALVLVAGILTLTIWQTIRVRQLDNDLGSLKREVESLRQRLGINYLEDLAEFQKEYTNVLIHDPSKLDDLEGEDDDDDDDDNVDSWGDSENEDDDDDDEDAGNERTDYDEYLDLIKQETDDTQTTAQINQNTNNNNSNDDEIDPAVATSASTSSTSAASNDDNVFDDFTSYNDSKKKRERKSRSIAEMRNDLQSNDVAQTTTTTQSPKESSADPTSQSRPKKYRSHSRHGRQRILVRKGESPVSAKSAEYYAVNTRSSMPAAHFHLNRKVPHHHAPIQMNSYQGDMYVGHATASNDNQWQQHFSVNNGMLTVNQPGLYYVYAQICYNNTHDQNGFIIFHGHNAFLQCLNTVPTNMPQKVHTCHTSGLIQLQQNESIHLRDIHRDRNVMLRDANNRSYFGIIKI